jgi:hypothetical protein
MPLPTNATEKLHRADPPCAERSKGLPLPMFVAFAVAEEAGDSCARDDAVEVDAAASAFEVAAGLAVGLLPSVEVIISPVVMVLGPMTIGMRSCSVFPLSSVVVTVTVLIMVLSSPLPNPFEVLEACVECSTLRVKEGVADVAVAVAHA